MPDQDLSTQFDTDWQKAQERYQKYVNAGLPEADAAKLFIAPVDTKWKIIRSSPQTFEDKKKMAKINSDFEDATIEAGKSAFDRNSMTGNSTSSLVQKWMTEVSADKAKGKLTAAEKKTELFSKRVELRDIQSEIRRTRSRRDKFNDELLKGFPTITDAKEKDRQIANAQTEKDNMTADLADYQAKEKTALAGFTNFKGEDIAAQPAAAVASTPGQPAAAAPGVSTPVDEQGKFYNRILANEAAIKANPPSVRKFGDPWTGDPANNGVKESDYAKQLMSNFAKRLSSQMNDSGQVVSGQPAAPTEAAPQMPNPHAGQFYIGGDGRPPLTNFVGSNDELKSWLNSRPTFESHDTQSQADAAWAARNVPIMSPPADAALTADPASSYDVQQWQPPAQPTNAATVRVRNSDGKVGTIPKSELDGALEAGYTLIK